MIIKNCVVENELFATITMNDGSILSNAKIGLLHNDIFEWIINKDELIKIVQDKSDKRMLAFCTKYVQGKIIKENINMLEINDVRIQ